MPKWPWSRDSANVSQASSQALLSVIRALLDADAPEDWGRIASQYRPLVLSDVMLKAVQSTKSQMAARGIRGGSFQLDALFQFITTARARGIETAVAEAKRKLDALFEAMQDYLTAPMPETRVIFERHRAILASDEGIEYVRAAVGRLKEPENGSGPAAWEAQLKNAFSNLRVHFLDDARSRGVDYAEQRFNERLAEAVGQGLQGYRNALDPNLE